MIRRISFPACGCKLTQNARECQEIQRGNSTPLFTSSPARGWPCTVLLALEMRALRVHCWPRFLEINTEDTEKSHRAHRESGGEEEDQTTERETPISLWFSVTLCVLCVAFFGIDHG